MKRATLMLAALLVVVACGSKTGGTGSTSGAAIMSFSGEAMGTTWSVRVGEAANAAAIVKAVRAELETVENEMSHYRDTSEISRFNAAPADTWFPVSPGFAQVVALANFIHEASGGAFDATLGPVIDVWGFGKGGEKRIPTDAALAEARRKVGQHFLALRPQPPALKKLNADLQLNLSAIAKGHGVDRVAMALEALGITNYLVEVGGEVRTRGDKSGVPWTVIIEGLRNEPYPMKSEGSIATSGDYRINFEKDGKRYSHLIDPRTGRPVSHVLASASVFAPTCAEADAWATAMMILGPEDGMALAEKLDLAVALIVRTPAGFEYKRSKAFTRSFDE